MTTVPRHTNRPQHRTNGRRRNASTADVRPRTPDQRGDDILMIARKLCDLLTKENQALRKHKVEIVQQMSAQKEDLAKLYQRQLLAFHKDPNLIGQVEPGRRSALKTMGERLSELMRDNASLLRANIEAINRLMKTVVEAVKENQQEKASAYSKSGAIGAYAATRREAALSCNTEM